MSNIGYSTLTVIPSMRGLEGALSSGVMPVMASLGTRGGASLGSNIGDAATTGAAAGIGAGRGRIVAAIAGLGIGALVVKGVAEGIDALSAAVSAGSDLSESLNALKVTYGDASTEITRLGETAATRLGLSNVEFNALATQFSSFAGTIAGTGGDVTGVLDTLTTRGADFASVMNLDVNDALDKFQSGLAGETEPLKQYGIDMSDAATRAFAASQGIGDATGAALTESEKVQARYGLLMQLTDKFSGDFANTSDGLANGSRKFNASLANIQASIGTALLPTMETFMTFANNELVPILQEMGDEIGPKLATAMTESTPAIIDLVEAVVPLLPAIVDLATSALPAVVTALQIATPVVIWLTESLSGGYAIFAELFRLINGDSTIRHFTDKLTGLSGVWANARDVGAGFAGMLRDTFEKVVGFGSQFVNAGRDLFEGLIDGVKSVSGKLLNAVLGPVKDAVNNVKSFLQIKSPSRLMFGIGQNTGLGMIAGLDSTAAGVADASSALMPTVPGFRSPTVTTGGLAAQMAAAAASSGPVEIVGGKLTIAEDGLTAVIEGRIARYDAELTRDFSKGYRG